MTGWMLPDEAFEWLAPRLSYELSKRRWSVLEFGSGVGSARLASMCRELTSVEHDPSWAEKRRFNHRVVLALIVDGWYCVDTVRDALPSQIDALIVDGPPGAIGRYPLLHHLDLFPPLVPMLIDDVHRPSERELALAIAERRNQMLSIHVCRSGRAFGTIGWWI